jgi:hypothetical protein
MTEKEKKIIWFLQLSHTKYEKQTLKINLKKIECRLNDLYHGRGLSEVECEMCSGYSGIYKEYCCFYRAEQ